MGMWLIGRFLQFLILLIGIVFVVYPRDFLFLIVSFFGFLFFGAVFEEVLMRKVKRPKYNRLKLSPIVQSLMYVHFMVDFFAKCDWSVYNFSESNRFIRNLLVYFIVSFYFVVASLLFSRIGHYALLIYLIPAITNVISFWRHDYQII